MQATETDLDIALNDLGPLAWVLEELRKSLDTASKALKRYVRDAEAARGSELATIDDSQLRVARQQLHQAVGALEMVGLGAPASLLRAMEAVVQKFVQHPELCNEPAAQKVERAGFALTEYLQAVLSGKKVTAVALFPQYRDIQELAGSERLHPADLWSMELRWLDPQMPADAPALAYETAVRSQLDQWVLKVIKGADTEGAKNLVAISLGLAAAQDSLQPRAFWKICAGFFEALALGLCVSDLYAKRTASRVLMQYAALAKGDVTVPDRLALDLLFFCAQSLPSPLLAAPSLSTIRQTYGLERFQRVDYAVPHFGRIDPALVAQARKRIGAAKESWTAFCGGDVGKLKQVSDQFNLIGESLLKLNPSSAAFAQALTGAIDATVRTGQAPSTELSMEVATSVLYLEVAFEDMDPNDSQIAVRTQVLADRLQRVQMGGQPQPLESWMEELYSRVSDKQTMGSVVSELRGSLGELEASLDQFFRNPADKSTLTKVPGQLSQMRGVLSVLGLDQASQAVLHMRERVEQIMVTELDVERARAAGTFDKLGNNLGSLGFLIDMLNYQPALAKKLFVYDEKEGELKPLMGRSTPEEAVTAPAHAAPPAPVISASPVLAPALVQPASVSPPAAIQTEQDQDEEDEELLGIFLEEAREVVQTGLQASEALGADPKDVTEQTTLRRAFHTLKGSSRMVGLNEFGEAAWSLEQLLNTWLADQKPFSVELRGLCQSALNGFGRWVEDIQLRQDHIWKSAVFRKAADAVRTENRFIELVLPDAGSTLAVPSPASVLPDLAELSFELSAGTPAEFEAVQPAPLNQPVIPVASPVEIELDDFSDFDLIEATLPVPDPVVAAPVLMPDFSDLVAAIEPPLEPPLEPQSEPQPIPVAASFDAAMLADFALPEETAVVAQAVAAPVDALFDEAPAEKDDRPEHTKVIGALSINIALYNVYLNEADEWSRRLVTETTEWALELGQPVTDSMVSLAHSLAGSSATVGFTGLSELARSLENAMLHVLQLRLNGTPELGVLFTQATEEVRRLLHQFAAGFLKEPDADLLLQLKQTVEVMPAVQLPVESLQDFSLDSQFIEVSEPLAIRAEPEPTLHTPAAQMQFAPMQMPAPPEVQHPAFVPETAHAPEPIFQSMAETTGPLNLDDDIDVVDVVDPDLFPIFEEEAAELFPQLGGGLRQWAARPADFAAKNDVLRVLHTLKGSARLSGAMRLGEMAHRMESDIEHFGGQATASDIEPLLANFDALQTNFENLRGVDLQSLSAAKPPAAVAAATLTALPVESVSLPSDTDEPSLAAENMPARNKLALPATNRLTAVRQAANQAVRVRSQLLDRLVNQAGEVIITRSRIETELRQLRGSLGDMTGNLDRLRQQLREIELQAESQMQSRMALAKETDKGFDPLEFDRFTRVQELTRMMAESVHDVATVQRNLQRTLQATEDDLIAQARQTRELQRDLLRTRMVEFEGISERLYRVVRQASKDAGKQVKLDITGGSIEMDRGVLDRMTPAFEHLLRNCVAHGVELPQQRTEAGKDASGTIVIDLHQSGNDVAVEFRDDGAGLNLPRIREKAVAQGLVSPVQNITDDEAASLIFMPGFSTASEVTELAGRGVGMDVVRAEVNALGGRIETTTKSGLGTSFKLILPLTTAVTQVVMFRIGTTAVGVPANVVELVRRVTPAELGAAYQTASIPFGGEQIPFFWSGALLQTSVQSMEQPGRTIPVVVFQSASQRVALHVDEVLGNQEVVVKNLGPQLARLPGLSGMSVLASGAVVLIYNPVALATVYGAQAREMRISSDELAARQKISKAETVALQTPQVPLVLVVDDSITVRRVTQRLLQREGYRVAMAADGLLALEQLAGERPAVVLSDIEMPRMDGFDLARNIRADARLNDLPIIMITSRIAEKHREHAMELGVNHYLGKPYSEEELLALVRRYCATEQLVEAG